MEIEWDSLLLDAGIDVPFGKEQFNILCPFHSDAVASCSINIEKGVWICHAGCGQGSLKYFLTKVLQISLEEVETLIQKPVTTFDVNMFEDVHPTEDYLMDIDSPDDFKVGSYPPWIFKRGFSTTVLQSWGCGINKYGDMIIPVKHDNRQVGWISRRQNAVPKYMYSKGFKKSQVLFGGDQLTSASFICITEGALDTMWLAQHGFSSVALLGAVMSKTQEKLIRNLPTSELVLCLDSDEVGRKGVADMMTTLNSSFMVSYIELPKGYKDVQEIRRKDDLTKVIDQRYYW